MTVAFIRTGSAAAPPEHAAAREIASDEAGIRTSSHSGRRTFATRLNAKGVGMRTIQKLMGHRHIGTTALYCDVSDETLRNAGSFDIDGTPIMFSAVPIGPLHCTGVKSFYRSGHNGEIRASAFGPMKAAA
jgi:hypothetical protein